MTVVPALWGSGDAYSRWTGFLDRWSVGEQADPSGLPALAVEDLPPDTWDRLLNRISTAVSTRMQAWADELSAALSAAEDEFSAGRALAQARPGLRRVHALAAHPGLPEHVRTALAEQAVELTRRLQADLERGLESVAGQVDRGLVDARRRTLRDNPLTAVLAEEPAAYQRYVPGADWAYDPTAPVRRRVIIDPRG